MPLAKFKFAPGINKEGTEYTAEGSWFDSDKIRFRSGYPEKIGGWEKYSSSTYLGTARSLHQWNDLELNDYLGIGTNLKWYVELGGSYNDVTPLRVTTSAGDVTFSATDGSSTITVTDSSHGALTGDFVTFSGAASLGGNVTAAVLNQEYQILLVTSTNAYTMTAKDTSGDTVTADSSDSGDGGSSVVGAYQINTGLDDYVSGTGFGSGTYSRGTWGSADPNPDNLRLWSQDNFGEDLIGNPRGGGLYYWDASSGVTTAAINFTALSTASDAPLLVNQIMVSEVDRHVIAFGCNSVSATTVLDELLVRWSDTEDAGNWTPSSTNSAGGQRVSSGSYILGALKTRNEILIWTDAAIHSMRFIGGPFTFQFRQLMEGPSLISPKAAAIAQSTVFWMDRGNFYIYDGAVRVLPCSVLDYVTSDINLDQSFKIFAAVNTDFSEIMWFYPSGTATEIDSYVMYNYKENLWSIGTLARTSWTPAPTRKKPLAAGTANSSNYIYQHDTGYNDDGSAMTAYIESGDFDLQDGEHFVLLSRIIPDVKFTTQSGYPISNTEITITMKGKNYPSESLSDLSISTVDTTTTQSEIRGRARQAAIRIESSNVGMTWRLGDLRLELRPDGRR